MKFTLDPCSDPEMTRHLVRRVAIRAFDRWDRQLALLHIRADHRRGLHRDLIIRRHFARSLRFLRASNKPSSKAKIAALVSSVTTQRNQNIAGTP